MIDVLWHIGHAIAHIFHMQGGRLVTWFGEDGAILSGFRCHGCLRLYGVHASYADDWPDLSQDDA